MKNAILFDIDGTLLHARGLGRPAFAEAFAIAYGGARADVENVSFVGATDTAVIRALAAACGVPTSPAREERFFIELAKRLEPRLAENPPTVYPGLRAFLVALRARGFRLGVVTGNIRATAWAKLIHAGLADLFDFGAYADGEPDRDAIARTACERARALGAEPRLLVGDTPQDIRAAHAAGLPALAVHVAGWRSPEELRAAGADALLPGYEDLAAALQTVETLLPQGRAGRASDHEDTNPAREPGRSTGRAEPSLPRPSPAPASPSVPATSAAPATSVEQKTDAGEVCAVGSAATGGAHSLPRANGVFVGNAQPAPALPIRVLAWELTRRCPMACKHCRGAARDEAYAGELTDAECRRVLDTLAAAYPAGQAGHGHGGGKPLLILTGGEPMCRDGLEGLVRHAAGLGFPCVLAPCGRFATAERLRALKEAGIRALSISVDGPDAATHDAFRGVPGAFQIALNAMAAARAVGLPFQLNHTVTRAGLGTLRAMRDFARAQGATRVDYFFLVPVGRGAAIAAQCLTPADRDRALNEILDLDAEGLLPVHVTCEPHVLALAATRPTPPKSHLNGCMAGAGFCFLAHDGRLQPCGFFEADGGNVRDFGCDLPAAYRASPLFARLRGGPVCLARAAARQADSEP